jgi:hypothetical protein
MAGDLSDGYASNAAIPVPYVPYLFSICLVSDTHLTGPSPLLTSPACLKSRHLRGTLTAVVRLLRRQLRPSRPRPLRRRRLRRLGRMSRHTTASAAVRAGQAPQSARRRIHARFQISTIRSVCEPWAVGDLRLWKGIIMIVLVVCLVKVELCCIFLLQVLSVHSN